MWRFRPPVRSTPEWLKGVGYCGVAFAILAYGNFLSFVVACVLFAVWGCAKLRLLGLGEDAVPPELLQWPKFQLVVSLVCIPVGLCAGMLSMGLGMAGAKDAYTFEAMMLGTFAVWLLAFLLFLRNIYLLDRTEVPSASNQADEQTYPPS